MKLDCPDEISTVFEKAWNTLAKNYHNWEGFLTASDRTWGHAFPYGKHLNEADIVQELVSEIKRSGPGDIEIHLNVPLTPKEWPIMHRYAKTGKDDEPEMDIVMLKSLEMEGVCKPFSLLAEVKFDEPTKTLRRGYKYPIKCAEDIGRLKRLRKSRICKHAFFCYLDEYHTRENRRKIRKDLDGLCGRSVEPLYLTPKNDLKKGKDGIIILGRS